MTRKEFDHWLLWAEPQKHLTYHTGMLICDREHNRALNSLARRVWDCSEAGFVKLTQLRLGENLYDYIAQRTGEIAG